MAVKTADIKKRITGGSTKYGPSGLFLGEHEGEMWATNKYWLTRAERIAPLLEQYNLSADVPGTFEVNGTVRPATGSVKGIPSQPIQAGAPLAAIADARPGIRVKVAGQDAYTMTERGDPLSVYLMADGTHAGLLTETLAWLSDTMTAPLPEQDDGTHVYYGNTCVLFHKAESGGVQAIVRADVTRVLEPSRYDPDPETGKQVHVPAVTGPAGSRVLGLMMGHNYNA